jgi:hypothetical protein
MLVGGVLGVIVGVVVALFVVPPYINDLFGTSDVSLGDTYDREGRTMTVVGAERVPGDDGEEYPGFFEVTLEVTATRTWEPTPSTFELEVSTSGGRAEAAPPDPARPETSLDFPLGEERVLVLRFPGSDRRDAVLEKLHVSDPRVRFHLQPGDVHE